MKYTVSDFYFLSFAHDAKARTIEDAYEGLCICMGQAVPMPCLLRTIRDLVAGGYITVEPEGNVISAVTPITVTAEGKRAAAISPIQKLLGQDKAHRKNELRFCDTECPALPADDLTADTDSFDDCVTRLIRGGHISRPTFEIGDMNEGYRKVTVHHPNDEWHGYDDGEDEETDPDTAALSYSAAVTCTEEQVKAAIRDLVDTAYLIATEPPRARKVAIHGADGSLLISLANASSEQGSVSFRMTVSKIRFNRQRFVGKRDSDLDYAQCGDPILIHEMASAEGFAFYGVLHDMLARPDLLTEEDFGKLSAVHHNIR
jgi:hypothetical protein